MEKQPFGKGDLVVKHDRTCRVDERFRNIRRLGSGSFGTVDLVEHRRTGARRVCKAVNVKDMKPATLALMKKEIMLLQELDHPRIVKLYEYAEDVPNATLLLVMEYLPGGDCDSLIQGDNKPGEPLVARLLEQVLSALAYCHARGIVHCDMKPENVILTGKQQDSCHSWLFGRYADDAVDCKVIDFGLAAHFTESNPESVTQVAGTPAFIAPEVIAAIRGGSFGAKADVWSVGVMAYNLLTGALPFGHHRDFGGDFWQVFHRVEAYDGIDFDDPEWEEISESACDMLEALMSKDPRERPSASAALQMPFFKEHVAVLHKKIRRSVLRSLRDFARAPAIVKICLLLIAARTDEKDVKAIRRSFMRLDVGASGVITQEELRDAVRNPGGYCPWCCYPQVNVDEVFDGVDLRRTESIEYTEFVAACLYSKLESKSGRELVSEAFKAVDEDGDGLISADEVLARFSRKGTEDMPLLNGLPQDRAFDEKEFHHCLTGKGNRSSRFLCCGGTSAVYADIENVSSEDDSDGSSSDME